MSNSRRSACSVFVGRIVFVKASAEQDVIARKSGVFPEKQKERTSEFASGQLKVMLFVSFLSLFLNSAF